MKKTAFFLCICFLAAAVSGCAGKPVPETTEMILTSETEQQTEEETIVETTREAIEIYREPEEIYVYPFSGEELAKMKEAAKKGAETLSEEHGVLRFEPKLLEFDPMLTEIRVRQQLAADVHPEWTEKEYYSYLTSYTLIYSASYDHEVTYAQDVEDRAIGIHLLREGETWKVTEMGLPTAEDSPLLKEPILPEGTETGRVLAVYGPVGAEYRVYEETEPGRISLRKYEVPEPAEPEPIILKESVWQIGNPVVPQPGDTADSWNPKKAADYPSDAQCSDAEFLEKWMAVEGLSQQDLKDRDCTQLVLVSAQETDGVQALITCYERRSDGAWAPAEGLARMSGYVGLNGIRHGRQRNSVTSPAGLWKLGTAFGSAEEPEGLQIPWRQITPRSDWVCDENSVYFNTWQERDDPKLQETWDYGEVEHLENYKTYAYACVIEFNNAPYTIPDRGCAIFFHCSDHGTGGCIGLLPDDMVRVLQWMDREKNPHILISGFQLTAP